MGDAVGNRWRRWGHDRLYVRTSADELVGYWNFTTGTAVLEPRADRVVLEAAVADHLASGRPARPAPVAVRDDQPVPLPQTRRPLDDALPTGQSVAQRPEPEPDIDEPATWVDLAANRPGAGVRARAVALRRAAPFRTLLDRLFGRRTEERRWRLGAEGEEAVGAEPAGLGGRWRVLHLVPLGDDGIDIDHVVIGPAGAFTVNTKNHPDASVWVAGNAFRVNYQQLRYVRQSLREARDATRLLEAAAPGAVTVTAVIAVVGARCGLTVKRQSDDVVVIARRDVQKWLRQQPERITDAQVETLFAVARRFTTWKPAAWATRR